MEKGVDYTGICVVFYCHDGKGNFVMSKRNKSCRDEHDTWDPGGGGIEFGIPIEKNLEKEIKEEYCTDILKSEFLGIRDVHRKNAGRKTHWIALDFKCLVDPTKVRNGEPHKFDGVRWFTLDTLPSKLHSQMPKFIKLYDKKLRS